MNSKNHEEVRNRRAKASTSRLNLYQKTVLVAGVLALFLALGLNSQGAPFLAAGVPGGTLLVFLILRNLNAKKEGKNKADPQGTFPKGEEALEPDPISSRANGEIIADSPEAQSEQTNSDALQKSIPSAPEEAITTPEILPVEKKDLSSAEVFSGDGVLAQIQEGLATLEDKVTNLEDMILSLEEKLADMQETQLKSAPHIDLQTILTKLDGKHEKIEQ